MDFKKDFCEKVYSAYHYYSISDKNSNTFRLAQTFVDDIDRDILMHAIETTYERYPYLRVRRIRKHGAVYLVYNDRPIVVIESNEPITIGGEEVNEHLIVFSYYGNKLYYNGFHGLCDGRGFCYFQHTFLYYYCKEKYGFDCNTEGIRLLGDEIKEEEYIDPFPRKLPKNIKPLAKRRLFLDSFHLKDDKRLTRGERYSCIVTIDEKEFMKHCRLNDGSPIALMAVIVARAVKRLNPDNKKPINAGIEMDLRSGFGAPQAHHSLTDFMSVNFSEKIAQLPFSLQNTALRGQIFLRNDPETIRYNVRPFTIFYNVLGKLPSIAIKKFIYGILVPMQFSANTFLLSYVGQSPFGELQKYITDQFCDRDAPELGISGEIINNNGKFMISFVFDFKEDIYLKAICDELKEQGIEHTCTPLKPYKMTKCTPS